MLLLLTPSYNHYHSLHTTLHNTGMNINAASLLIPWGVFAYTMSGGLKAAFLAACESSTHAFVSHFASSGITSCDV
jgi:hypothetical protein